MMAGKACPTASNLAPELGMMITAGVLTVVPQ